MAAIDVFSVIAPEFAGDEDIPDFISFAQQEVSPSLWGIKADRGVAYLAAHMMAVSKRGGVGPGGALTSEKVGDLSQSYTHAQYKHFELPYVTTTYGQEFIRLRRTLRLGPILLQ